MDIIPMPDNALVIKSQNIDTVDFTVNQQWMTDEDAALAIKTGLDMCIIKSNVTFGESEDIEGECIDGLIGVTVVVYYDDEFDPDECEACNVDDLTDLSGDYKFCAYRVEVPCEPTNVECGEPSAEPSVSPSALPTSAPSNKPSGEPSAAPSESLMPTDCFEPAQPKIIDSVCMTTGGEPMDIIPMPDNAIVVNSENIDTIDFTVNQQWTADDAGLAIEAGMNSCIIKGNVTFGDSENIEGECYDGLAGVTVVVYFDEEFNPEECEACNVDDLTELGGEHKFCAYRIEIPCEPVPVECGEPSAEPSGSFYPSSAPSETPTESFYPSSAPSSSPSESPTKAPTNAPTASPSASPSGSFYPSSAPSDTPTESMYPSSSPTDVPTKAPTPGPTKNPTQSPTLTPTKEPTSAPTNAPTLPPTNEPTKEPTPAPTNAPSLNPTKGPTDQPSSTPTQSMYPSSSPTNVENAATEDPTGSPTPCPPSLPILIENQGDTMYPDLPVIITQQNTTHVGFKVENTFASTVSSIFTEYHSGSFGETECLEEENVEENAQVEVEFLATCMHHTHISVINVWVTDCDDKLPPFLVEEDDAEIPECCHPSEQQCKTVQYTFKLPCISPCPDENDVSVFPIPEVPINKPPILEIPINKPIPEFPLNKPQPTQQVNGGQYRPSSNYNYNIGNEGGLRHRRRNLSAAADMAKKKNNSGSSEEEGSTEEFEAITGHNNEPDNDEDHFCVVEDYPCGPNNDKVHVCHYSSRDGYKTFCVPEADSDALRFYPKDYCGPCVGFGYAHTA